MEDLPDLLLTEETLDLLLMEVLLDLLDLLLTEETLDLLLMEDLLDQPLMEETLDLLDQPLMEETLDLLDLLLTEETLDLPLTEESLDLLDTSPMLLNMEAMEPEMEMTDSTNGKPVFWVWKKNSMPDKLL